MSARDQLLVLIDPVARRTDGESVRIAKDVLGAAASVRVCLPDGPEDFAKALARRGARRLVVVGDDRALIRAVAALHRERELTSCALSVVPVGAAQVLTRALGVPSGAVAAARAVLEGVERRLDLLVDDRDGVVLGELRIPPISGVGAADGASDGASGGASGGVAEADGHHPWLRSCQSFVRTLASRPSRPSRVASAPGPAPARLRVEADGVLVVDLDQPVEGVLLTPGDGGYAEVEVRRTSVGAEAAALRVRARTITVSGADFRYRADAVVAGPVRTRTWTVRPRAWGLTLPK
ncbi:diacylglycerol kinase family protein [Streptomyces sp. NPDC086554]|uniref:diacylglycerol kinase family protein n=1 Tax=Streptomyces sp. NPDC086554 TaxID=3154864 RepID=UPI0034306213